MKERYLKRRKLKFKEYIILQCPECGTKHIETNKYKATYQEQKIHKINENNK
jgi:hypothetical protein